MANTRSTMSLFSIQLLAVMLVTVLVGWIRLDVNFLPVHMDEYGYLFVGRQLLSGNSWPSHSYIFGADFNWYFFGFFDRLTNGLEGARFAAAALGIFSLAGCYCFYQLLWSRKSVAVIGTLLLALSSSHLFVSRIATYDIVSFSIFCWGLVLAAFAVRRNCMPAAVCGALLIALAVLSKYIVVLYLPLIALIWIVIRPLQAITAMLLVAFTLVFYCVVHFNALFELYQIQIAGVHSANTTGLDILTRVFLQAGLPLLVSFFAVVYGVFLRNKNTLRMPLLFLLIAMALPLPLYHLVSENLISLYKHLVFALFFLCPAVAWLAVEVVDRFKCSHPVKTASAVFVVFLVYVTTNQTMLAKMHAGFPDTSQLLPVINHNIDANVTILSEDPYLFRYLSAESNGRSPQVLQSGIKETSWLDNDNNGSYTSQDVKDALWDGKYELVLLTDQVHPDFNDEYRKILLLRNYQLLHDMPYQLTDVMTQNTHGRISFYRRS